MKSKFNASFKSWSLSKGTTPTCSHTKPPARLANAAVNMGLVSKARHKAATLITVSPAPDTSAMFLKCAGIISLVLRELVQIPFSESVSKIVSIFCFTLKLLIIFCNSFRLSVLMSSFKPSFSSFKFGLNKVTPL